MPFTKMPGAVVVHVPVHGALARPEELHAIHADVARAILRVAGEDAPERDVAAAATLGERSASRLVEGTAVRRY